MHAGQVALKINTCELISSAPLKKIACRTCVNFFSVFRVSGGQHEASAERESRAACESRATLNLFTVTSAHYSLSICVPFSQLD